jgi:hypothetical protein
MGTEAVHRALVRFAQGELGKEIGPPNDVGFENFDWPTLSAVREALEAIGIGYGVETSQPGRFYEYPRRPARQRRRHSRQPQAATLNAPRGARKPAAVSREAAAAFPVAQMS